MLPPSLCFPSGSEGLDFSAFQQVLLHLPTSYLLLSWTSPLQSGSCTSCHTVVEQLWQPKQCFLGSAKNPRWIQTCWSSHLAKCWSGRLGKAAPCQKVLAWKASAFLLAWAALWVPAQAWLSLSLQWPSVLQAKHSKTKRSLQPKHCVLTTKSSTDCSKRKPPCRRLAWGSTLCSNTSNAKSFCH